MIIIKCSRENTEITILNGKNDDFSRDIANIIVALHKTAASKGLEDSFYDGMETALDYTIKELEKEIYKNECKM